MREYIESVLRRTKSIPYKPYVRGKHVESILGTRKNMTKKVFNLNNTITHSVHLVDHNVLTELSFGIGTVNTMKIPTDTNQNSQIDIQL
jgi:hypothetical protein